MPESPEQIDRALSLELRARAEALGVYKNKTGKGDGREELVLDQMRLRVGTAFGIVKAEIADSNGRGTEIAVARSRSCWYNSSVSYELTKAAAEKLTKPLVDVDKAVSRVLVSISPNQEGDESLFFRVVLKEDPGLETPSKQLGARLQRISAELRRRAASLGAGFAYVSFVLESELPRPKRKTA